MIGFQGVEEAPLCSTPFIYDILMHNELSLFSSMLAGKVFSVAMSHNLILSQTDVLAKGFDIANTLSLNQTISVNGIYNIAVSQGLTLVSNEAEQSIFRLLIDQPLFLTDDLKANNVYAIEICNSIPIIQRLGWLIELTMSNSFTLTMEQLDGIYSQLNLIHDLTTNMDDLTCVNPFGTAPDKGISNTIVFAQSLNAKFVYAATMSNAINILATVARR